MTKVDTLDVLRQSLCRVLIRVQNDDTDIGGGEAVAFPSTTKGTTSGPAERGTGSQDLPAPLVYAGCHRCIEPVQWNGR